MYKIPLWCWLGIHRWKSWTPVIEHKYGYYRRLYQQRFCAKCNKEQHRVVTI